MGQGKGQIGVVHTQPSTIKLRRQGMRARLVERRSYLNRTRQVRVRAWPPRCLLEACAGHASY
mgnify:CR=1 FL=1